MMHRGIRVRLIVGNCQSGNNCIIQDFRGPALPGFFMLENIAVCNIAVCKGDANCNFSYFL